MKRAISLLVVMACVLVFVGAATLLVPGATGDYGVDEAPDKLTTYLHRVERSTTRYYECEDGRPHGSPWRIPDDCQLVTPTPLSWE